MNYLSFKVSITSKIRTDLRAKLPKIAQLYKEMHRNSSRLQSFFTSELSSFKKVSLFRRPIVYLTTGGNVHQFTSTYAYIKKYIGKDNPDYVLEHVEAYFEPLFNEIDKFELELQAIAGQLKTAMSGANELLESYLQDEQLSQVFLEYVECKANVISGEYCISC